MRRKRLVGNQQTEDLLAGRTGEDPSDAGLAALIAGVRSTYLGGSVPAMSAELLDAADALVSTQPTLPGPNWVSPIRRRYARMTTFLAAIAAKLAALSLGAKVALAATVAAASVGGLGLTDSLPDPIQDTFDVVIVQNDGSDLAIDGDTDDTSFSSDFSIDEDGEMDAAADGTNTTEGAPQEVLALLQEHCGDLAAAEYDWSFDTSLSPDGETDTAYDFSCEYVDANGCEVDVDFSFDSSQTPGEESDIDNEGVNVEVDCGDGDESAESDDDDDDDTDNDEDDDDTDDDDTEDNDGA